MRHPANGERAGAFSGEAMRGLWRGISSCQAANGRKSTWNDEKAWFYRKFDGFFSLKACQIVKNMVIGSPGCLLDPESCYPTTSFHLNLPRRNSGILHSL